MFVLFEGERRASQQVKNVSRKTIVGLTVSVLLLVAGGSAAWWWRSRAQPAPARGDSRRAAPTTSPTAASVPVAELVLQVNRHSSAQIGAGSPVFFSVTLIGRAPEAWTKALRLETADGQPFAPRLAPLGAPFTLDTGGRGSDSSPIHRAELGVGPDDAARIPTGTHTIRAVLPLSGSGTPDGRLVSDTVTLVRQDAETGGAPSAAAEKARLESVVRFNLLSEKWEDAHRLALQLVERQDADAAAYILFGDALNGLRRDEEALAAYYRAMAALRSPKESPDYLFARMHEVQMRLEASKGKKE